MHHCNSFVSYGVLKIVVVLLLLLLSSNTWCVWRLNNSCRILSLHVNKRITIKLRYTGTRRLRQRHRQSTRQTPDKSNCRLTDPLFNSTTG